MLPNSRSEGREVKYVSYCIKEGEVYTRTAAYRGESLQGMSNYGNFPSRIHRTIQQALLIYHFK